MDVSQGYITVMTSIAPVFLLTFIIAQYKKDNSIIDIAYGATFCVVASMLYVNGAGGVVALVCTVLVLAWGARLTTHLAARHKGEDWRYAKWRKEWGKWLLVRSIFQIYVLQGIFILVMSTPLVFVNENTQSFGVVEGVGIVLFLIGLTIELVSDAQLQFFRKSRKSICKLGLWKYSRHPNYLGEILIWWGVAIVAMQSSILSIVSPLLITGLLVFVSAPMVEEKYLENKEYQEYKNNVGMILPKRGKIINESRQS